MLRSKSRPDAPGKSAPPWQTRSAEEVCALLQTSATLGLETGLAERLSTTFGPSALPEPRSRSLLAVFAGQFANPLIYLLFGAAALALIFGEVSDAVVIALVVLVNAVIGAFQEGRAQRSLAALRRLSTLSTRVVRSGVEARVEAAVLVPGDLVLLEAGDAVPADARLVEAAGVRVSEAALTGESAPVDKSTGAVAAAPTRPAP
jgi:Ca2+-transporting ATPase